MFLSIKSIVNSFVDNKSVDNVRGIVRGLGMSLQAAHFALWRR